MPDEGAHVRAFASSILLYSAAPLKGKLMRLFLRVGRFGAGLRGGRLAALPVDEGADLLHQFGDHGQGAVHGVGPVGQLDGADAAVLDDKEGHRLDVDARAGTAAEQVLVGSILAVKVRACGCKAKADFGHRKDGGAVLGGDGLAHDGVGIHHLTDLVHRDVH